MSRIVIATCAEWPQSNASDRLLRDALVARGATVEMRPWNEDAFWPAADRADLIVMRAAWDYPLHVAAFERWLVRAEAGRPRVVNAPALMRWNMDKRYVLDLAKRGVAVPRTARVHTMADLDKAFAHVGAQTAVIKPCHGASGRGVAKVDRAEAEAYLEAHAGDGRVHLLQELLAEIVHGELSFVFIAGQHTHTVRKTPAAGEFRVNSAYGPASNALEAAPPHLVAEAARILAALPSPPLYARIDTVPRGDRLVCLEVEVIEPTLFLHLHPPAAEAFADALVPSVSSPKPMQ